MDGTALSQPGLNALFDALNRILDPIAAAIRADLELDAALTSAFQRWVDQRLPGVALSRVGRRVLNVVE